MSATPTDTGALRLRLRHLQLGIPELDHGTRHLLACCNDLMAADGPRRTDRRQLQALLERLLDHMRAQHRREEDLYVFCSYPGTDIQRRAHGELRQAAKDHLKELADGSALSGSWLRSRFALLISQHVRKYDLPFARWLAANPLPLPIDEDPSALTRPQRVNRAQTSPHANSKTGPRGRRR